MHKIQFHHSKPKNPWNKNPFECFSFCINSITMRRPEFIYISKSVRSYQSMSHPPVSSSHINRQTQFFYCLCEFQLWFNSVSYALPKASKKPWQNVVCLKSMRNQLSIHLTELFNWKNLSQWGLRLRSHFTRFKKIIHMLRGPSAIVFFSWATKNIRVTHSWSWWNIACKSERETKSSAAKQNIDVILCACV